ncbi:Serine phosphatase RsbU, regulator of sigma subunit [Thermoflexibacter ruber]|uniref:Serine phosphatase RsbU, regulator of sigma subunit n=2 Tax=Thermoflexibacter ruber TaxID=1003 RepID=A0A1I2IYY1_9BACT|nr:Serine phosphatase RsbU, regulator of sigma subunit [Thermoflexibacter ruber]
MRKNLSLHSKYNVMKRHLYIIVFLLFTLLLQTNTFWVFSQTIIYGKVVLTDGKPLKDVSVVVDNQKPVITTTMGIFGVEIAGNTPQSVKATKKNFTQKSWKYDEKAKKIQIVMEPLTILSGELKDENEKPIANAKITLSKINPDKPALTNNLGQFNVPLPEGADISKPGEIYINGKQIPSESFSLTDGNIKIKASKNTVELESVNNTLIEKTKILEEKKITKIKVMDLTGSALEMQKITIDGQDYITDAKGEVLTQHEISKDSRVFMEGFKIKILPTEFYLLINAERIRENEEVDTTQVIEEIIKSEATISLAGNYKEQFNQMIADLEVRKQMLLQMNEQTRLEILEITKRLIEDPNLSKQEREELNIKRIQLEQALVDNELAYQDAVEKTKVALDSMRIVLQSSELERIQTQREIEEKEKEAKRNLIIFGVIAVALAAVVLAFFIANRRVKKEHEELEKAKGELEKSYEELKQQKNKIEQQNNFITTSIRYAETMQKAILPLDETFNERFDEFLKIFLPKDIVSGDFYWLSTLDNLTFFALVDCTGHGVPGAFMSLIGNNSLNEIVNQKNIHSPAQILEELNTSIRKALRQTHTDNDDGMDVALCAIAKPDKEGLIKVTFAGAKRNMVYCSQAQGDQLLEIKGDKKTIGGFFKENRNNQFTNHEVVLQKGDVLYFYTDGLTDQPNIKQEKFGSVRLKSIIKENLHLSLSEQQIIIMEELNLHKQGAEQRDDMSLIGLRL